MMQGLRGLALLVVTLALPTRALAAEREPASTRERFGQKDQIVIGSDFMISMDRVHHGGSDVGFDRIFVAPALDVFVNDGFSVGGQLTYVHASASGWTGVYGTESASVGIAPRVGYAFSVSELWSIYPRISLGYNRAVAVSGGESIAATAFVPVLVHPAEHFFVGMGPFASRAMMSNPYGGPALGSTTYGLQSALGGYF
jgi:hypothetical protein